MKHRDWSGAQAWCPKEVSCPSSLEEIQAVIRSAKERGLKIRAVGSMHSFNDICVTPDIQVHTDKLDRVLSIDRNKLRVRVEGGIKLERLVKILADEGLALPNQGYILKQSIAGATATATHGTGHEGSLSSFIEEIELVDANGNLCVLNPSTNEHLFSAAVVNLGCLGIIYALTLRCVPLYRLKLTRLKTNLEECFKTLPEQFERNDNYMFGICPYSGAVLTGAYKKTNEPVTNRRGLLISRLVTKVTALLFFKYLRIPNSLFPRFFGRMSSLGHNFSCVEESYRLLSPADEGLHIEEEVSVPMEHLENAVKDAQKVVLEFSKNRPYIVFAIVVRFTGPDPYGYLSPTLHEARANFTLITLVKGEYRELFRQLEEAMMKYNARPHWGKLHSLTKEKLQQLYPETYHRFVEARKELDPEGLFANDYILRLF